MPRYNIAGIWQMWGVMEVEADSLEEAKQKAVEDELLPLDSQYVEDSFEIDEEYTLAGAILKGEPGMPCI